MKIRKVLVNIVFFLITSGIIFAENVAEQQQVSDQQNLISQQEEVNQNISKSELKAEIKIGTSIENREVVGESNSFPNNVQKLYCWSKIIGAKDKTHITHIWHFEGNKIAEIQLAVNYPSHRTWSSKTIFPDWKGSWKVQVVDADGKLIGEKSFEIVDQIKETQQESTTGYTGQE